MSEARYRVLSFNGSDLERRLNELDVKGYRVAASNAQWIILRKQDDLQAIATPLMLQTTEPVVE